MKRADTLTRKSVQSLEKAVFALDARTRKDNTTGKAALMLSLKQPSTIRPLKTCVRLFSVPISA